jgi:hypothetical protein
MAGKLLVRCQHQLEEYSLCFASSSCFEASVDMISLKSAKVLSHNKLQIIIMLSIYHLN